MTAQARLKLARDRAGRDEKLFGEGIIAETRLRQSQAELTQAEAEYGAQRAALRAYGVGDQGISEMSAGKLSTTLAVAAPISGVVLEQLADVGSRAEMGAPLYRLADLSRLILEIQLPTAQANSFRLGQMVSVAGSQASGRVTAIGAQVGGAQTVTVRAAISDPQNTLRPGQSVEARASQSVKGGVWNIPSKAIAWQSGKPYVFAATSQGFRAMPVSVQVQTPQSAMVSGLQGNERIAVSGLAALKSLWQGGAE
jgi:membrane fusion protein, heavy metal efflux system